MEWGSITMTNSMTSRGSYRISDDLVEKAVRYFHKVARPTFMGEIAVHIGCNLAQTEQLFEVLQERGIVRLSTIEECHEIGVTGGEVYSLTTPANVKIAHLP
jgi:hypothetical protein